MSDNSAIEWCDATWNPVRGCVKVSPGCAHCYAETFAERFRGVKGHPYEQGFDLRLVPEKLTEPLSWKKPRRVFVNSMSDLFQDGVPDSYIDQVFAVMALAPQHTFQVLTKRPERMRAYFCGLDEDPLAVLPPRISQQATSIIISEPADLRKLSCNEPPWPLPNVWLGVSVENQHFADERIPLLLQTPAAVRFISAEPLLGPVSFEPWMFQAVSSEAPNIHRVRRTHQLDWLIVGGESGPGARPFDLAWARSIVAQCQAAGVPVFVKQLGAKPIEIWNEVERHDVLLHSKKGGDPSEWPEDLRIRQFPVATPPPGEDR